MKIGFTSLGISRPTAPGGHADLYRFYLFTPPKRFGVCYISWYKSVFSVFLQPHVYDQNEYPNTDITGERPVVYLYCSSHRRWSLEGDGLK